MKLKIASKIGIAISFLVVLIVILAFVERGFNTTILKSAEELDEQIFPQAVLALNILDEVGDLNSNVLEYVGGEEDEQEDFAFNMRELRGMLNRMNELPGAEEKGIPVIDSLVLLYEERAREKVFRTYDPEKEAAARHNIRTLTQKTGTPLEQLLDSLKESEIADAAKVKNIAELVKDDLPGVQLYLELVDEAGDMLSDLNAYLNSKQPEEERNSFETNALSFKEYLGKLKPLEMKPEEMTYLNRVDLLFTTLYTSGVQIMNSYDPATKIAATRSIDEMEHGIFRELETRLDKLANDATLQSRAHINELLEISGFNQSAVVLVILLVLLIGTGIIIYTYYTILNPISKLNSTILSLSQGRTDVEIYGLDRSDEIGELSRAVMTFKSTTEERSRMERQLLEEKGRAEEATRYKSDFLANMSHEIRTPMNAITGLLGLVLKTDLNSKQHNYLRKINIAAKNLLGILNDILDFSKIEAGKLTIESTRFELSEVLQNLAIFMQEKNVDKELELIFDVDTTVPTQLVGDPLRIGQVLLNLASNALKFTSHGQIVLSIGVIRKTGDSVELEFKLSDTGIGIEQVVLDSIFQPFIQADHSHTRRFGGTGLGLAITHQLVELMGGDLQVDSTSGKGTCFHFILPLEYSAEEESFISDNIDSVEGKSVLVADRNDLSRTVVERELRSLNMKPTTVDTGAKALTAFDSAIEKGHPFNMALIDWNIQDISYADLAHRLKMSGEETQLYMLFSTSSSRESVIENMEQSDADGILLKPFSRSTLFDTIVEATGREEMILDYHRQKVTDAVSIPAGCMGSQILVAEDNEINREVIKDILEDLGMKVTLVEDGEQAVEELQNSTHYDLILMDVQMPRMDGLEATRAVRRLSHRKSTPILALTAHAMLAQKQQCIEAGMNDHISKPIEHKELVKKLADWLPVKEVAPAKKSITGLDIQLSIDRLGGSGKTYYSVLRQFVGDSGEKLISQLKAAAEENSCEKAANAIHSFKSVAGTVGAGALFKHAVDLEQEALAGSLNRTLLDKVFEEYKEIQKEARDYFQNRKNTEQH